jgi:hypothetical protein
MNKVKFTLKLIKYWILRILYIPIIPKVFEIKNKITLGSEYGGKTIYESPDLENSIVLSAGAGEDISFDIELINKFKLTSIIIDPTPRSIAYFQVIRNNFGQQKSHPYADSGYQNPETYDLRNISDANLKLIPKALWKNNDFIKFYYPKNKSHVSMSALDIQRTKQDGDYILVESVDVLEICLNLDLKYIPLIKFDIEGSALEVMEKMFNDNIFPGQIIIEIDELYFPNFRHRSRAKSYFKLLKINGYELFSKSETGFDFSFIRKELIID